MIITFSGTGNSLMVARLLGAELADNNIVELEGASLQDNRLDETDSDSERRIIWVFPTYSWGIPPVVKSYIESLTFNAPGDSFHHLVVTCGDDVGNLGKQWQRLLKRKRWKAGGMWSVQMPNTYVLMKGFDVDPDKVEKEKLSLCRERVAHVARRIETKQNDDDLVKGKFAAFKTSVIYPWFVKFNMSPRPFFANDHCTGCSLCAKECPTMNITMTADSSTLKPLWGAKCALCLRCYHHCPVNAVQYGKATRGKGQYQIDKVLAEMER